MNSGLGLQWRIYEECGNLLFGKIFAQNCMKMKEIGASGGGGGILVVFPRSANTNVLIQYIRQLQNKRGV